MSFLAESVFSERTQNSKLKIQNSKLNSMCLLIEFHKPN